MNNARYINNLDPLARKKKECVDHEICNDLSLEEYIGWLGYIYQPRRSNGNIILTQTSTAGLK